MSQILGMSQLCLTLCLLVSVVLFWYCGIKKKLLGEGIIALVICSLFIKQAVMDFTDNYLFASTIMIVIAISWFFVAAIVLSRFARQKIKKNKRGH